jgi:hypothetical protein
MPRPTGPPTACVSPPANSACWSPSR